MEQDNNIFKRSDILKILSKEGFSTFASFTSWLSERTQPELEQTAANLDQKYPGTGKLIKQLFARQAGNIIERRTYRQGGGTPVVDPTIKE